MRVAFFGTPDFALPSLETLVSAEDVDVVLVVSQPDRARSRGKVTPTPVKARALELNLPVATPESVNDEETMDLLEKVHPDLLIVIAYGQKLGHAILDRFPDRILNIHGSRLPRYRGAAPIQRALLDGCKMTGNTIMLIGEGMDTGDILQQSQVEIFEDDDTASLTERMSRDGADLLLDVLRHYPERLQHRISQRSEEATIAAKITKEDGWLRFTDPLFHLMRRFHTVHQAPGARVQFGNDIYKVHGAHGETSAGAASRQMGEIIRADGGGIAIQASDGLFVIDRIQAPNRKQMPVEAFLNGNPDALKPGMVAVDHSPMSVENHHAI